MESNFDVIVIGSGFGASPPALHLATAGLKVLMLEKGDFINPQKDFKNTQSVTYLRKYYKHYPGKGFGVNVIEGLGGGSGFYLGISLRAPSLVFNKKGKDGGLLWPKRINRKVLDPYYNRAEEKLKVSQIPETEIPKNGQIFSLMMRDLGYSIDRAPLAVENCIQCGYCISGCKYDAKQSLFLNYLPEASKAGAMIRCGIAVDYIKHQPKDKFKYTVYATDVKDQKVTYKLKTKHIILGAGAIGSASILLRSKKYLTRLSTTLGQNLKGNIFYKKLAIMPDHYPDGEMYKGYGVPGIVSYEFIESHNVLLIPYKALPVQIMAKVRLGARKANGSIGYWGKEHARLMKKMQKRMVILTASGYLDDSAKLTLNWKDEIEINLDISEAQRNQARNIDFLLKGILTKSGCTLLDTKAVNWKGEEYTDLQFDSTHPVGSCNMANSIDNGTVDSNGEVFNYPGLFVTDASCIPSPLIVPPSLTILAIAERASDYIVDKCRNHENY